MFMLVNNSKNGVYYMKKLGFIGAGNLAGSIIKGLTQGGKSYQILVFDLIKEKTDALNQKYKVMSWSLPEVVNKSELLILAVKPKDIPGLLKELSKYNLSGKLIISVAAGIGLKVYEKALPGAAVVRVMPNTSSAVLHSVSGLAKGKWVTQEQAVEVEKIFTALGKVLWIEDSKMNALTAVSGSGPAYFYLFTEYMALAGQKLGLTKEESEILARETLIGAGKMLAESGKSPAELREAVTSPNGTTYAALSSFQGAELDRIVYQAMLACARRGEEMEEEFANGANQENCN